MALIGLALLLILAVIVFGASWTGLEIFLETNVHARKRMHRGRKRRRTRARHSATAASAKLLFRPLTPPLRQFNHISTATRIQKSS